LYRRAHDQRRPQRNPYPGRWLDGRHPRPQPVGAMGAQHSCNRQRLRNSYRLGRNAKTACIRRGRIISPRDHTMQVQTIAPVRDQLASRRAEAIKAFRQHLRPDTLLSALRRITDQALRELVRLHPLPSGAVLVAVGGYGRGELYPYSDVDVLILLNERPDKDNARKIEGFVAAMWDLGIEPGHSVRTIDDCKQEAANDITVETALMEA